MESSSLTIDPLKHSKQPSALLTFEHVLPPLVEAKYAPPAGDPKVKDFPVGSAVGGSPGGDIDCGVMKSAAGFLGH
ncbi:hypothetical protein F2Q70_00016279 [Brassica cretica]|uniref:Uncharacterized protein n=1 Tax=Brassica cretica TaxID=69181 RepID=A0A8S9I5N4_BRACR|nr:hypothetical protein F2Q70_00016279 [Brassica cretica]KAF2596412.1 hypothetical protein F2Q68_00009259 [Brassica cretica]